MSQRFSAKTASNVNPRADVATKFTLSKMNKHNNISLIYIVVQIMVEWLT